MTSKVRVLIVDDHKIVRDGLRTMISAVPEYEVIGEAGDGVEAIAAGNVLKPDLVLMDISMPKMTGIAAAREIKALHPETKVLMLTVQNWDENIVESFKAGADGYVSKQATRKELLFAIESVCCGNFFISPEVSQKVIDGYVERDLPAGSSPSKEALTAREQQILKLIASGHSNKKIADSLFVSVKTVARHRSNIMAKLNIHSVQELTVYAMRKGFLSR